jgi:CHAT domain-containing protein
MRSVATLADVFAETDRLCADLAHLNLSLPAPEGVAQQLLELEDRRAWLESKRWKAAVAADETLKEFRAPTFDEVRNCIPPDAVVLDFFEYEDPRQKPAAEESRITGEQSQEAEEFAGKRLAAFVVTRSKPTVQVDLGPSDAIAELVPELDDKAAAGRWIQSVNETLRSTSRGLKPLKVQTSEEAALEMRRLVWLPLEPHLGDAQTIIVSPDGVLNRVNLLTLPGREAGKYLLEERTLVYVPAALLLPELLRGEPPGHVPQSLFLLGDADFDSKLSTESPSNDGPTPIHTRGQQEVKPAHFDRLPETRAEVEDIAKLFAERKTEGQCRLVLGPEAREALVRREAPQFSVVHISTHGDYVVRDDIFVALPQDKLPPALRAMLALAGANRGSSDGADDGILTALEIGCLDWRQTEMVVLSSCASAQGKTMSGECAQGMLRSMHLAGVDCVVASLGEVDDRATRLLMVRFYQNLFEGKLSRAESLREAQLWLLNQGAAIFNVSDEVAAKHKRLPPYYWANFVVSGDWR